MHLKREKYVSRKKLFFLSRFVRHLAKIFADDIDIDVDVNVVVAIEVSAISFVHAAEHQ